MSSSSLERALKLAVAAHDGQFRDGTPAIPYSEHPIGVMARLRYIGKVANESVLTAALLHDVLEETEITESQIKAEFGGKVAQLVREMTRTEPSADECAGLTETQVWLLRSLMLIEEVSAMSRWAQAIKTADRLSNLEEALAVRKPRGRRRYVAQSLCLLEVLDRSACPQLHDALNSMTLGARMNP